MKKNVLFTAVFLLTLLLAPTASAHELWIEVQHKPDAGELQADVTWGHFGAFYEPAAVENLSLFVRYPDGQSEELLMEKAGIQGRAFIPHKGDGEYVFWATRSPGTYTPGDGITRLSIQLAKAVFTLGDGPAISTQPTDLFFEIVPAEPLGTVTPGTFSGKALLDGEPVANAAVSAYGPGDATVTGETNSDGTFSLNLPTAGDWVVKVSFEVNEEGTLNGENYTAVGRTTTLAFTVFEKESTAPITAQQLAFLVVGLMLGAGGYSLFAHLKTKGATQ